MTEAGSVAAKALTCLCLGRLGPPARSDLHKLSKLENLDTLTLGAGLDDWPGPAGRVPNWVTRLGLCYIGEVRVELNEGGA